MKKILVHENKKDPVYIAVTIESMFHVIHQEKSIGSHYSVGAAVASAMKTFDLADSRGFLAWRVIA